MDGKSLSHLMSRAQFSAQLPRNKPAKRNGGEHSVLA